MTTSFTIRREHILAVLAALLLVTVAGTVAVSVYVLVQDDANLANNFAGLIQTGSFEAPIAR